MRAFHLIIGCVPSYTSYQDSSEALTVESPLLSYLNVWLLGFLPQGPTNGEARHQWPIIVRESSLELVWDSSGDTVFHSRAMHIPVEAPIANTLIPPNSIAGMVPSSTTSWGIGCPSASFSASQSPPRPCQRRKKVADDPITEFGTLPIDQPAITAAGTTLTPQPEETPQRVRPTSQLAVIRSHVASTSLTSTSKWECYFQLGDKVLPTDSYIWTWRNGLGGQVSNSLGKALFLPTDQDHYADC